MSADRFDEEARRLARQVLATVDYDQARAIFDEGWQEDPEEAEHTASLMTSQLAAALRAAHAEGEAAVHTERTQLRAALAEVDQLRAELEAARREADDAREERDHWHAKVAHIGQALGMAAPESGDWRDVSAVAVARRAEAARVVVEAAAAVDVECDGDCQPGIGVHRGRCGALVDAWVRYRAATASASTASAAAPPAASDARSPSADGE
jgi:hypothetical protein